MGDEERSLGNSGRPREEKEELYIFSLGVHLIYPPVLVPGDHQ